MKVWAKALLRVVECFIHLLKLLVIDFYCYKMEMGFSPFYKGNY